MYTSFTYAYIYIYTYPYKCVFNQVMKLNSEAKIQGDFPCDGI